MTFQDFANAHPDSVAGLRTLSQSVESAGLDRVLIELVKIRSSQINGCAYCVQFHINLARKLGCTQDRLDQIIVWRDSSLFDPRERAALDWAETLTKDAAHGATPQAAEMLGSQFTQAEIEALTIIIATINTWNRIAGALHFDPPPAR